MFFQTRTHASYLQQCDGVVIVSPLLAHVDTMYSLAVHTHILAGTHMYARASTLRIRVKIGRFSAGAEVCADIPSGQGR